MSRTTTPSSDTTQPTPVFWDADAVRFGQPGPRTQAGLMAVINQPLLGARPLPEPKGQFVANNG